MYFPTEPLQCEGQHHLWMGQNPFHATLNISFWLPTPFPAWWVGTHQTQCCPLGSMLVEGSSSSSTEGLPSKDSATHSCDTEKGLSQSSCTAWHCAHTQLLAEVLIPGSSDLWEMRVWERLVSITPLNRRLSLVAQGTGWSLRSGRRVLISAWALQWPKTHLSGYPRR